MSYTIDAVNEEIWAKHASLSSKYIPMGPFKNKLTELTAHSSYDMIQDGYDDTPIARIIPAALGNTQVVATGGAITYANGYKFHTFTAALTEDFANPSITNIQATPSWNGWTFTNDAGIAKNGGVLSGPTGDSQPYFCYSNTASPPYTQSCTSPALSIPIGRTVTLSFKYAYSVNYAPPIIMNVFYSGNLIYSTSTFSASTWLPVSVTFTTTTNTGSFSFSNGNGVPPLASFPILLVTAITLSENLTVTTGGPVSSLVVGGGGGGGGPYVGGGGGAGAALLSTSTLTGGVSYAVTVASGGASPANAGAFVNGVNGSDSSFNGLVGTGGGGGGAYGIASANAGSNGGCGGGGGGTSGESGTAAGGLGNPGKNGGLGGFVVPGTGVTCGGGGGGMSTVGIAGTSGNGGAGGAGQTYVIGGTPYTVSGGGGAGGDGIKGAGGTGGGGTGGGQAGGATPATSGTANTGGGGGGGVGGGGNNQGGSGGSGIVIVAYLSPPPPPPTVAFSSFLWQGTQGSTSAAPRWNFLLSGTAPTSLVAVLQRSPDGIAPFTAVETQTLSNSATFYAFSGATIQNNYYIVTVTASNAYGTSSFADSRQNVALTPAPNLLLTSFSWLGVQGSTSASPQWIFSNAGGPVYAGGLMFSVQTSSSAGGPFTDVAFGTLADNATSYTYSAATVPNIYYRLNLQASNSSGVSDLQDTRQNSTPSINATGGTVTTPSAGPYAGYKVHTFTANGVFRLNSPSTSVLNYICVGAGASGGNGSAGGGGGGNVQNGTATFTFASSPYTVTLGAGGAASTGGGDNGVNGGTTTIGSSFISAIGGGAGGGYAAGGFAGGNGGGAGGLPTDPTLTGGASTVTGTFAGFSGGNGAPIVAGTAYPSGAGGGGAGGAGASAVFGADTGCTGGVGKLINGTYYGGGGGGGAGVFGSGITGGAGGQGGGGGGGGFTDVPVFNGDPGQANTGGGGGGGGNNDGDPDNTTYGGAGGSGVVLIYYLA